VLILCTNRTGNKVPSTASLVEYTRPLGTILHPAPKDVKAWVILSKQTA
jgi:hypothetical protein